MDNLSLAVRSRTMRGVRSHDTTPERIVRSAAHTLGFRFRLKRRDLPGSPDLTFPGIRAAVFVHGCYWHQHRCSRGARQPKTNRSYWLPKLQRNVERDRRAIRALRRQGWRVLVVWECQTRDAERLRARLGKFLGATHHGALAGSVSSKR
jgi:DNA mismatch endonuclease (patch repair protein)